MLLHSTLFSSSDVRAKGSGSQTFSLNPHIEQGGIVNPYLAFLAPTEW